MHRLHVGRVDIHHDEVGFKALLHQAAVVSALGQGACAGHRIKHLLRRKHGRIHGLDTGRQRHRLGIRQQIQAVVGGDAVGAQSHVHALFQHLRHVRDAAGQLHVGHGTSGDRRPFLPDDIHVALLDPHAVSQSSRHVQQTAVRQIFDVGTAVSAHLALRCFALRLRRVDMQMHALLFRQRREALRHLLGGGVLAVQRQVRQDAAVCRPVPILIRVAGDLVRRQIFERRIVEAQHGVAHVHLAAGFGHGTPRVVQPVIHIRGAHDAGPDGLRHRQLHARVDVAAHHLRLEGEDLGVQPVLQVHVFGIAPKERHSAVGVGVVESRHQQLSLSAINRAEVFLRLCSSHIRDASVLYAHELMLADRKVFVNNRNVGKYHVVISTEIRSVPGSRRAVLPAGSS